ncbi:Gfo/Idh/MocA family protein [Hydrogenothermus marinus]|uniref:Oxidoreductase family protein n=1 Tax=Hydrogenothermus marinus TaxID=133270 RepID=A0A3M0BKC1_9AQUI|nr:Gfo/Idh/MocA family oxidoreductase [Hydrogenothermus marinus]RMA97066.1 oxidoreductase family protein [Hydrogenothermus marinus]
MKVGIVGIGNMGRHYVSKFKILGYDAVLVDLNQKLLAKYDSSFKKYTDIDEALKKEKLDYLFVATAPTSHIPIAKKALEKEINVMVEKPPSINPKELEEAIDLAEKKGVVLGVSEIELRSNSVRNFENNTNIHEVEAYRLNLGRGYINPFYDLAWHDLYIFQYLFDRVKINKVIDKGDIFDIYGETDKNEFFLQVAWSQKNLKRKWILKTKNGDIVFDFVNDKIIYPSGEEKEKDGKDKLETMIKEFIENPTFESSYRALEILKEFDKFNIKEKVA